MVHFTTHNERNSVASRAVLRSVNVLHCDKNRPRRAGPAKGWNMKVNFGYFLFL